MAKHRHVELDLWRGLAVVGMVVYHFFYIGDFYKVFSIDIDNWPWVILAKFVQIIFLGLVGVSLTLSKKVFRMVFVIFACAMTITLATFVVMPARFVIIGILHQITISILLLQFIKNKSTVALVFGLFALIFGLFIKDIQVEHSFLLSIIGFKSAGFHALDYFPIFPWISLPAFGIFFGNLFYKEKAVVFKARNLLVRFLALCGRNSLVIYMGHLLLIILVMMMLA